MTQHVRIHWGPIKGRRVLNFNWNAITRESVVHVTATEYKSHNKDNPYFGKESAARWAGDANIWVSNISPHGPSSDPNLGVTFVVHVDWDNPLPIVTDITVFDELPVDVQFMPDAVRFG